MDSTSPAAARGSPPHGAMVSALRQTELGPSSLQGLLTGLEGSVVGDGQGAGGFHILAGRLTVQLLRAPRILGEDGQLIAEHLGEPTVDEQNVLGIGRLDSQPADTELAEQRRSALENADLTVPRRESDELRLALQHRPLGGDDAALEGSRRCHGLVGSSG